MSVDYNEVPVLVMAMVSVNITCFSRGSQHLLEAIKITKPPWCLPNQVQKLDAPLTCKKALLLLRSQQGTEALDLLLGCAGTEEQFPGAQGASSHLLQGFHWGGSPLTSLAT